MGLFSGNKTQQTTSVTNLTDASNIGLQLSDDASSVVLRGDNSSVEVIDAGAVNAAFGFAERTAGAYADATRDVVGANSDLASRFIDTSADLARRFSELTRDVTSEASARVAGLASENASDLRSFAAAQNQSEESRVFDLVKMAIIAGGAVYLGRALLQRYSR
jgi:hypothetical protein